MNQATTITLTDEQRFELERRVRSQTLVARDDCYTNYIHADDLARLARAEAEKLLSKALLSFLRESRQLSNVRTTKELRLKYRYPTSDDLLREVRQRFVASNTPGQMQLL